MGEKKSVELENGIRIAYVERGDAAGDAVLFLHGYTDTSRSFLPTMERLAELRPELRILGIDQRGHGDSSMPSSDDCRAAPERCFRPEDVAADALAFLDALGIEKAHVVGHSMGSFVAQEIALEHPERVARLALIGTAVSLGGNAGVEDFLIAGLVEGPWRQAVEGRGLRFPDDAYELTPLDLDPDAETWMAANWVADPTADPAFLAEIVPETSRTRLGTWIGAARALSHVDNTERLKRLSVPVLVLWPTQDSFFPEPDQARLRATLAAACGARSYWKAYGKKPLPKSGAQEDDLGHNLQWGAPDAVAADLAAFLREGGAPTTDLAHADPEGSRRVLSAPNEARIVVGPSEDCSP